MTTSGCKELIRRRRVLLAHEPAPLNARWHVELDEAMAPAGLAACRVHSRDDVLRSVEHGGFAAAVLIGDRRVIDGLSLLGAIRAISAELPCWLVANETNRWSLQRALALRAVGVLPLPVPAGDLVLSIQRHLTELTDVSEN